MSRIVDMVTALPWHDSRVWQKRPVSSIKKIIIHQELADGKIEDVNKYHITPGPNNHLTQRGAPHFAYHFGIRQKDPCGEIVKANELNNITWHTKGQNARAVGIMLEGNFEGPGHELDGFAKGPDQRQIDALEWLVPYLLRLLGLSSQDVYGHYHFGKPACPGHVVTKWIEDFRTKLVGLQQEKQEDKIKSVTELQTALAALGFDPGEPEGKMGPRTAAAVRNFQRGQGLAVDGVPGPQTRQRLMFLLAAIPEKKEKDKEEAKT